MLYIGGFWSVALTTFSLGPSSQKTRAYGLTERRSPGDDNNANKRAAVAYRARKKALGASAPLMDHRQRSMSRYATPTGL